MGNVSRFLSAGLVILCAMAQQSPIDIPMSYDFCRGVCAIDLPEAIAKGDRTRLRVHAWNVFAGMTQMDVSSQRPYFMTWYTKDDVFGGANPNKLDQRDSFLGVEAPLKLVTPASMLKALEAVLPGSNLLKKNLDQSVLEPIVSKVFYNRALYEHIQSLKTVDSNGTAVSVVDSKGRIIPDRFCDLKMKIERDAPQIADQQMPAFPGDAVAVKTAWWPVSAHGLTALPVWDPESNSPQPNGNSPTNELMPQGVWPRWVAVDPSNQAFPSKQYWPVKDSLHRWHEARVVPLSSFFSLKIQTTAQLAQVKTALGSNLFPGDLPTVEVGDYVVLVGLHFTTKEIPDWVWGTFWWHDEPEIGPYARQRPSLVLSPWKNYLMNASYGMVEPPNIVFNPYLEAPLAGGMTSNCMSCHRRAVWPASKSDKSVTARGEVSPGDATLFANKLKLDFLWTLANVAVPNACSN